MLKAAAFLAAWLPAAAGLASVAGLVSQLETDAWAQARGGGSVAWADGASAALANPALLPGPLRAQVRAGAMSWLAGTSAQSFAFGLADPGGTLGLGFGLVRFESGAISRVEETAQGDALPTGETFEVGESVFRAALGKRLGRLALGAGLCLIQRDYWVERDGFLGVDLGLAWGREGGPRVGLALQQLGAAPRDEDPPTRLRLGAALPLPAAVELDLELDWPLDQAPTFGGGVEWTVLGHLALRAGYRMFHETESWRTGLGVFGTAGDTRLSLDYALKSLAGFELAHLISVGAGF